MEAFVPPAGASLSTSRVFVAGTSLATSRKPTRHRQPLHVPDISAIKLPKIPDFKPKPADPAQPADPAKPAAANISVAGRELAPVGRTPAPAKNTALSDGLPKFYNPDTSRAEFRATAKGQNSTPFDRRIGNWKLSNNRRVNEQDTFRNMDPYTDDLVWARPGWSSDEARVGVRIALRNILGNAHLFDSEIAELSASISCVTDTANIKEFVRAIGLSNAYRTRFFDTMSNTRFVECNFQHFLGRAPRTQQEVSEHIQILQEKGYNAEINSYVDCDEYDTLFGESRIPAVNFRGGHPYDNDMNKLALLNGGDSTSDRIVKTALLQTGDTYGYNPYTILKGLPSAWRGENSARNQAGPVLDFDPDAFWNPQPAGLREAEVAWTAKFGTWNKFWYKDSVVFKEVMTPKMSHTVEEVEEAEAILKYGTNMAKSYLGSRKAFDVAPVIEVRAPSTPEAANGQLAVTMTKISGMIPSDLQQKV